QKQARTHRHSTDKASGGKVTRAQQEQAKRTERDRELNLQRQKAANEKAAAAQVKQLIEQNRLERKDGDIPYSFVDQGKVKNIMVSAAHKAELTAGRLVIIGTGGGKIRRFDIVPATVAEKIAERDEKAVIQINNSTDSNEDDAYADYQIPDDLIW
ncbi:MAG: hypothetical protein ACI9LO_003363, partial [Planctomycetota bacterium]